FKKAVRMLQEFNGIVEQATEEELADAAALADRTGMLNCPHTGVALAALLRLLQRKAIAPHERVVVISTAHGLKFTEFKAGYHERRLDDVRSRYANAPVELPNDLDAVRRALFERIEQMQAEDRNRPEINA